MPVAAGPPSTIEVNFEEDGSVGAPMVQVPMEVEIVKHRAPNVVRLLEQKKKRRSTTSGNKGKNTKKQEEDDLMDSKTTLSLVNPPSVIEYCDSSVAQEQQLQIAQKQEDYHWKEMRNKMRKEGSNSHSNRTSSARVPHEDHDLKVLASTLAKSARNKAQTSHHRRESTSTRERTCVIPWDEQLPRARPQQRRVKRSNSVPSLASVSTRDVLTLDSSCSHQTTTTGSVSTAPSTYGYTSQREIGVDFSQRYTATRRNSIDRKSTTTKPKCSYEHTAALYDKMFHGAAPQAANKASTFSPPTPQFVAPTGTTNTRVNVAGSSATIPTNPKTMQRLQGSSMLSIFPGGPSFSAASSAATPIVVPPVKVQKDLTVTNNGDSSGHSKRSEHSKSTLQAAGSGHGVVKRRAPAPPSDDDSSTMPSLSSTSYYNLKQSQAEQDANRRTGGPMYRPTPPPSTRQQNMNNYNVSKQKRRWFLFRGKSDSSLKSGGR